MGYKRAMELLEQAAKSGHAKSMNNLGLMHKEGVRGAPQNDAVAVKWFAEAAEKHLSVAELNLAAILLTGRGTEKDEKLAAVMLTRAAESGDTDAMLKLAKLYVNGTGVPSSQAHSLGWLNKAA